MLGTGVFLTKKTIAFLTKNRYNENNIKSIGEDL